MKVVVTGGAGFIGSALVGSLLDGGHEVLVVDDLSTGHAHNVPPGVELCTRDVLEPGLDGALSDFGPDAVVHLAAQTSVSASVEDPEHDRRINVGGSAAVARASVACGAARVLFASSAAVYGEPAELPLRETSAKAPANPYGTSKLEAESVLADILGPAGVDHACLRLSNVYGPGQDARGEGGVVAVFVSRALGGMPLAIHGDGMQTRDFVYVGDVAAAFVLCVEHEEPLALRGPAGAAYNVSSGSELSVRQVAEAVADAVGDDVRFVSAPTRPGDVRRSVLDPSAAATRLGWSASTPFSHGIARTVEWFRSR